MQQLIVICGSCYKIIITEKDSNINWFSENNKRRYVLVQFYAELELIGVNEALGIKPDYHRETFRFVFNNDIDESLLQVISPIISKYEKLIDDTCIECGDLINKYGSDFFCAECYLTKQRMYSYHNINDLGFSDVVLNFHDESYTREFFYWSEFLKADFIFNNHASHGLPTEIDFIFKQERVISDKSDSDFSFNKDGIRIRDWYENYFRLIKYIPDNLLDYQAKLIKADLINNLIDCLVCSYKAVFTNNRCLVCGLPNYTKLTERLRKRYASLEEVNKYLQLLYYTESKNKYKYPRREVDFEKSKHHDILITEKDLDDYFKRI